MNVLAMVPMLLGVYGNYNDAAPGAVSVAKRYLDQEANGLNSKNNNNIEDYKVSESRQKAERLMKSGTTHDRKEQKRNEVTLSDELKSVSVRNELASFYCQGLLELYQFRYGAVDGFLRFHRDSQSVKETTAAGADNGFVLLPDYTCTSYVGWNPVVLKRTVANGRPEEKNTIALNVIMSSGFRNILIYLIENRNEPKVSTLIKSVFDHDEFNELEKRYWASTESFVTFQWNGWNSLRNESREFQPDSKLKKKSLKGLYSNGKISREEMVHHLSNPAYGVNPVLGRKGCVSVKKTLREAGDTDLMVTRDQGKYRWTIKENSQFMQEIIKRSGRPVAGPSGTSFRLMKIGRLCSNYLKNKLGINSDKELNKLLMANCVAYVVPDDHSVVEVEMSAQDLQLLDDDQNMAQQFI